MQRITFLLLIIYSCFSAQAQKVKIEISPMMEVPHAMIFEENLYSDSDAHYLYFYKKNTEYRSRKYLIQKLDKEFKVLFSKEFIPKRYSFSSVGIEYFNRKFGMVEYERDDENKILNYHITFIDMNGEVIDKQKIASVSYEKILTPPLTKWVWSADSTKVLFISEIHSYKKKHDHKAHLTLFDSSFNKIWSKQVQIPSGEIRTETNSWTLTNSGSVYFISEEYIQLNSIDKELARRLKLKPKYISSLHTVSSTKNEVLHQFLKESTFFKEAKMKLSDDNKFLLIAGLVANSPNKPVFGVKYLKVFTEDNTLAFTKELKFTDDEISSFGTKSTSKDANLKQNGLTDDFTISDIICRENDEFTIQLEENILLVIQNDINITRKSGSIISIDVAGNGTAEVIGLLPKRQLGFSPFYEEASTKNDFASNLLYYSNIQTNNQLFYLYNDHQKNIQDGVIDPDRLKIIKKVKHAVAILAHFDEQGNLIKKPLFSTEKFDSALIPKFCKQINNNSLFFVTGKKNYLTHYRFGVLTIE